MSTVTGSSRQDGIWTLHAIYYDGALESYERFEQRLGELAKAEAVIFDKDKTTLPQDVLNNYIMDAKSLMVLGATTQVLCAMAVEALLNLYGVMHLGEHIFKRGIERLSPAHKLEFLVAVFGRREVKSNEEIVVVLRRIFEARNSLVHPKAREDDSSDLAESSRPGALPKRVRQIVKDMKTFFELFGGIGDDTKKAVEYCNPSAQQGAPRDGRRPAGSNRP